MKLKTFWILFALVTSVQAATPATMTPPLRPVEAHALAAQASAELLSRFHYQNVPLDDAMSIRIFDRYLKTLDPERIYLLQSDIDTFGAVPIFDQDGHDLTGGTARAYDENGNEVDDSAFIEDYGLTADGLRTKWGYMCES